MAPKPHRTSSELSTASTATNSSTSSASSTTLQCNTPASPTTGIFARIRNSRSRSPQPRSMSATSAIPSPTTHQRPERLHIRTDSGLSVSSPTSSSPRTRSRNGKRNSTGTVMQVGRHSNEWLFGGFSFTETMRGLLSPSESESGRDRD